MVSEVAPRDDEIALVVTSIAAPNRALAAWARDCAALGHRFIVIGDAASPPEFELEGCDYFGLDAQLETGIAYAQSCPIGHYARKNIGYLLAIRAGANIIVESDDDNYARQAFWLPRQRHQRVPRIDDAGWCNAYRYFSDELVWPRGLPLDVVHDRVPDIDAVPPGDVDCPIQQGLVDGDPDVDAIQRLVLPPTTRFRRNRRVALGANSWCPFNSQNTCWWRDAFALLYLPAYCSFRVTDIWRSFVAQRIAWTNGWAVLFHGPDMRQNRNPHDLLRDFADEIPGHLHNRAIRDLLEGLELIPGLDGIADNMRLCYDALIAASIVDRRERDLLDVWLGDLAAIRAPDDANRGSTMPRGRR